MRQIIVIALLLLTLSSRAQVMVDIPTMMQEEQLARDVYQLANEKYQMHVFECKINAETNHWTMLRSYSETPNLEMPAYGSLSDSIFKAAFSDYQTMVTISATEALKAGAMIEETDIFVLEVNRIKAEDEQLKALLDNLITASEQHLSSFLTALKADGVTYTPSLLSEERIQRLMNEGNCKPGAACKGNSSCSH